MINNRKAGFGSRDQDTELADAKSLYQLCNPPQDSNVERITFLKERLLSVFLRLQRGDISTSDAKSQSSQLQEELSELILMLDDWQIQSAARN